VLQIYQSARAANATLAIDTTAVAGAAETFLGAGVGAAITTAAGFLVTFTVMVAAPRVAAASGSFLASATRAAAKVAPPPAVSAVFSVVAPAAAVVADLVLT